MARQRKGMLESLDAFILRLYVMSKSEDWTVREEAGFALRNQIEMDFDVSMALTNHWVHDESPYVRRAACLACMQRKAFTDSRRVSAVLERLIPLMADDDIYVRKCCGPFVVGYLGYTYPDITLPWLERMAMAEDINVRANVAKAFSQALGRHSPRFGLKLLNQLALDHRHRVRSAIGASMRNITKCLGEAAAIELEGLANLKQNFQRLRT